MDNNPLTQPLNILLVGSKFWPEYAGSAHRIAGTYERLARGNRNHNIAVLTDSTEYRWPARYTWQNYPVQRLASPLPRPDGFWGRILSAIDQYMTGFMAVLWLIMHKRPDVMHVYGSSGVTAVAILWASLRRIPLIIELVTDGARPWQTLPGLRYGGFLRLGAGTVIIAISQELGEACARRNLSRNVWVRPNPVDTRRFRPPEVAARAAARQKMGCGSDKDILLASVAKFMPQKNQLFLISVLAGLSAEFRLVLAGPLVDKGPLAERDSGYYADILGEIARLGLAERCFLKPGFTDAAEIMQAADVFLMPSVREGLGTAMLESMACATPVVANADAPVFRQWVKEGANGYLAALNPADWAAAIRRTLDLPGNVLAEEAARIRNVSGSDHVDAQFSALLQCVARNDSDTAHNVSDILSHSGPRAGAASAGPTG